MEEDFILTLLRYFFWFDLFLEARAEILEKNLLVFWKILRHKMDNFEIDWPLEKTILFQNLFCPIVTFIWSKKCIELMNNSTSFTLKRGKEIWDHAKSKKKFSVRVVLQGGGVWCSVHWGGEKDLWFSIRKYYKNLG